MAAILSDDGESIVSGVEMKSRQRCLTCMRRIKPGRDLCKCGTAVPGKASMSRAKISRGRQRRLEKGIKALQKEMKAADKAEIRRIRETTEAAFQAYPAYNDAVWKRDHGFLQEGQ